MTEALENYLRDEYEREDDDFFERRIGEYHASMASNCVRRNFLDYTEGSEPGEDAWPHFELGNTLEDVYLKILRNEHGWRNIKNSFPIEIDMGSFTVVGETDPVRVAPNGEIVELFEIKTTAGLSYVRNEPKRDHVFQVHCYMKALGLDQATIVYIQKTDLDTAEHVVEFDDGIWNEIELKFTMLHDALTKEEMPPPSESGDEQDYFCPFDDSEECCKNIMGDKT